MRNAYIAGIFKFAFYCVCVRNSVTMTSEHKTLTLEEKIKVIEEHEKNKCPAKELTVLFGKNSNL